MFLTKLPNSVFLVFFNNLLFVNSAPSSSIEYECIDCVNQIGNSFIKTLWWPISDFEFSCVNNSDFEKYFRGIIIGVACSRSTCKDILNLNHNIIYNNKSSPCELYQEASEEDGGFNFLNFIECMELILLGILLIAWLLHGKTIQALTNFFQSIS